MLSNQILNVFIYFAIGFLIPVLSRFLMKFYPCSLHSYIGDILKYYFNNKKHKMPYNKLLKNNKYNYLKKQYFYNKCIWGIIYTCLSITLTYLIKNHINESYPLILLHIFMFLLLFSANIDNRYRIIPDILTLPMLLIGILISIYCEKYNIRNTLIITPFNSIISSISAYILCFTISLMFYFKSPYSFGGGDVKLLVSIASFTGFENLGKILVISFPLMFIYCKSKKINFAPLAPFIVIAFFIWFFSSFFYS